MGASDSKNGSLCSYVHFHNLLVSQQLRNNSSKVQHPDIGKWNGMSMTLVDLTSSMKCKFVARWVIKQMHRNKGVYHSMNYTYCKTSERALYLGHGVEKSSASVMGIDIWVVMNNTFSNAPYSQNSFALALPTTCSVGIPQLPWKLSRGWQQIPENGMAFKWK